LTSTLAQALRSLNLEFTDEQLSKLQQYLALLQKWNAAFNLIANSEENEIIHKHLIDSLAINYLLEGKQILDFGTGAGLPGIPLAILNPNRTFVLLDSNGKKTRFLFQVKLALGLENVTIENCRIEHYKSNGQIDIVMCRAFSSLPDIVGKTTGLLDKGSRLLALKGQVPESEIQALSKDYKVTQIHKLDIPNSNAERHVVEIGR